jgi:hypothetical protein
VRAQIAGGVEEPRQFLARQDLGLALPGARIRDRHRVGFAPEPRAEEELQRTHGLVDRRIGQMPLGDPGQQPRLDLRGVERIGAAAVITVQVRNHGNVALLGALGQAAQHHRVDPLQT